MQATYLRKDWPAPHGSSPTSARANGNRPVTAFQRRVLMTLGGLGVMLTGLIVVTGHRPADEARLLTRMAEQGSTGAELQLGLEYRDGGDGLTPDRAMSRRWLTKAAEGGNAYAAEALHNQQAGTASETQSPGVLDELAARLHSPTLAAGAQVTHLLGRTRTERQSLDALRTRAERGDHLAQYQLGLRYLSGAWEMPRDADKAALWLERAARGGSQLASQALEQLARADSPTSERAAAQIRTASVMPSAQSITD